MAMRVQVASADDLPPLCLSRTTTVTIPAKLLLQLALPTPFEVEVHTHTYTRAGVEIILPHSSSLSPLRVPSFGSAFTYFLFRQAMRCRAFLWRNVTEPGALEIHGDRCEKLTMGTDQANGNDLQEICMRRHRMGICSDGLSLSSRYT